MISITKSSAKRNGEVYDFLFPSIHTVWALPTFDLMPLVFVFGKENGNPLDMEKKPLKRAKVNNSTINYLEQGEGEVVLLVHGTLGDYRSWEGQVEPFSKNYRVIAYSRRYHYPNSWPKDNLGFSVAIHAKDLVAFIKALKPEKVHLVGHSFGAYVALLAARDNPGLLQSLTLAEPPAMPLIVGSRSGDTLVKSFMNNAIISSREAFERGDREQGIQHFVDGVMGTGAYQKSPGEAREQMLGNVRELQGAVQAIDDNLFPPFICEDAITMSVPTLLIDGERSLEMFNLINDALEQCMPNNERATVPGASHEMQAENPKAFNKIVLSFLGKY